ncbi:hypothetical protein ACWDWO_26830 [Actinopolymorpha singaporensis]
MNILAQVLPGIRELRTPLVVGVLWILAGLTFSDLLPVDLFHGDLADLVSSVRGLLPSTLILSLSALCTYLVGVILTEVGQLVIRALRLLYLLLNEFIIVTAVIALFFMTLKVVAVVAAILITYLFLTWWQSGKESNFSSHIKQKIRRTTYKSLELAAKSWQAVVDEWNPVRKQLGAFLDEEMERIVLSNPNILTELVNQLSGEQVESLALSLSIGVAELEAESSDPTCLPKCSDHYEVLEHCCGDPELLPVVRKAVEKRIRERRVARKAFLRSPTVDSSALRVELGNRLQGADVQMKAQHSELYSEYDRFRVEAEFRAAVAVPFSVLVAGISRLVANDLGVPSDISSRIYAYLGAGLIGLLMLVAASVKNNAGRRMLYASLRQGVIENIDLPSYAPEFFQIRGKKDPALVAEEEAGNDASESQRKKLKGWLQRTAQRIRGRSLGMEIGESSDRHDMDQGSPVDGRDLKEASNRAAASDESVGMK